MCLSCTVTDIVSVEHCRDLEIYARGHYKDHRKMILFESVGTVSYSHSTVTMAVTLAVSTQYTDERTDTQPRHRPRLCIASRRKNLASPSPMMKMRQHSLLTTRKACMQRVKAGDCETGEREC